MVTDENQQPIPNAVLHLVGDEHTFQQLPASGITRRILPVGQHQLLVSAPG